MSLSVDAASPGSSTALTPWRRAWSKPAILLPVGERMTMKLYRDQGMEARDGEWGILFLVQVSSTAFGVTR